MATLAELRAEIFGKLPTVAEQAATRAGKAIVKPVPTPIRKEERKATKAAQEKAFRDAVWARDKVCRATRAPVKRSGSNWDKVGEVHHVLKRSTHPEDRLNPSNGILLTRHQHALAEATCPGDPGALSP